MKLLIYSAAILVFTLQSCSNDDESTSNNNTNSRFTWKENGGTEIKADSAFYETQYKTIKAFKNYNDPSQKKFIEINLTNGIPATYDTANGNAISFLYASNLFVASTGSITITENASNAMSGSFTGASTTGTVTSIEGAFQSIEIR